MPPPLTVLVDARNVLRSTWPNIGEGDLVARVARWGREHDAGIVAVFDGSAPAVEEDGVEVVGSGPRESADEWLTRTARGLAAAGERFWLVTSDRGLRAGAGAGAERIVGGGRFARELQRV